MDGGAKERLENRDSFGLDAAGYSRFRPTYPRALFEHLASLAPARGFALDCATGSGQAVLELARLFERVAAFDSSTAQIAQAPSHPRVEYRAGKAETFPFDDHRFDLVTIAQGAHWFDLPAFYERLEPSLNQGAIVAIWGYSYSHVNSAVDALVTAELLGRIEPYWADGNKVINEHYRTIEFPFVELDWPGFVSRHDWTREQYMQYIETWSAVRKYSLETKTDPVARLDAKLEALWPDRTPLGVQFDLVGRLGRYDGHLLG